MVRSRSQQRDFVADAGATSTPSGFGPQASDHRPPRAVASRGSRKGAKPPTPVDGRCCQTTCDQHEQPAPILPLLNALVTWWSSAVFGYQIRLVNFCTISTDVTAKEVPLRRMTQTCAERLLSGRGPGPSPTATQVSRAAPAGVLIRVLACCCRQIQPVEACASASSVNSSEGFFQL